MTPSHTHTESCGKTKNSSFGADLVFTWLGGGCMCGLRCLGNNLIFLFGWMCDVQRLYSCLAFFCFEMQGLGESDR